ncbi:BQ2448_3348 [Microbotryum intermedium]|uniref:BQ2448_3348 protein n=1 Tax=Microbotryum intermedium TaxID=269621 RepID=A0A238FHR0_9BASI|nr:BQ2448_3348 [Microbotryum intermedium]
MASPSTPYQTPRADLDITLPPRPFLAPLHQPAPSTYTPKAVVGPAFNVGLVSAGFGLFISSIKNSLDSHNKGAMGVFTRTGWMIGYFATAGFVYTFVNNSVSNLIQNSTNGIAGATGGCAAGFVSGIRNGSLPSAVGLCAFMGAAVGTYELAGGRLGNEPRKDRKTREEERLSFFKKRPETQEE